MSRICRGVVDEFRKEGLKVGMIRPKTLWPFPSSSFENKDSCKAYFSIEMSMGQMIDDVRLASACKVPVHFYGKAGGLVPSAKEITENIKEKAGELL
jgi:2-oxoglutarate ferredoxin oxidoreductase subunit alpha